MHLRKSRDLGGAVTGTNFLYITSQKAVPSRLTCLKKPVITGGVSKRVAMAQPVAPSPSSPKLTKSQQLHRSMKSALWPFANNFKFFDKDRDGSLDSDEFYQALKALQLPGVDEETSAELFDELDFDSSGSVCYDEIMRYGLIEIARASKDRLKTLFKLWDTDNSHTVDIEEFRNSMRALGFEAPQRALDRLFHELDEDNSTEISYEEFDKKLRQPRGRLARIMAQEAAEKERQRSSIHSASAPGTPLIGSRPTTPSRSMAPTASRTRAGLTNSGSRPPTPSDDDDSDDDALAYMVPSEMAAALREYNAGSTKMQEAMAAFADADAVRAMERQASEAEAEAMRQRG